MDINDLLNDPQVIQTIKETSLTMVKMINKRRTAKQIACEHLDEVRRDWRVYCRSCDLFLRTIYQGPETKTNGE